MAGAGVIPRANSSRMRIGAEQPRAVPQDRQPGVRDGQEPVGGEGQVGLDARVMAQAGYGPPVPAQHDGIEFALVGAEHPDRGGRGGIQRLRCLLLPAAGEAMLGPAARRAAPVDQPAAGFGRDKFRR